MVKIIALIFKCMKLNIEPKLSMIGSSTEQSHVNYCGRFVLQERVIDNRQFKTQPIMSSR